MKKLLTTIICVAISAFVLHAQPREEVIINNDWTFHLGDASSMEKDFTHGTEYFTYLAKAASTNHNRGPAWTEFDDTGWQHVNLPHDWVVDLGYARQSSHSHGYKNVGWRYPENNVGWYRHRLNIPAEDKGRQISIRFDGIFRNAQVFCNGFYLGHEPSGYVSQTYNITEYLNYGGENIITVRCDASTEEGWYYEGAGIYRDVWLVKTNPVHFKENGVYYETKVEGDKAQITVYASVDAGDKAESMLKTTYTLIDVAGKEVASSAMGVLELHNPHLWSIEDPYLYTLVTTLKNDKGNVVDEVHTRVGIRSVEFDINKGVLLNGKPLLLKGTNLHLDHAGVGVGVPDELWVYKINKLKALGSNAIRCSHNPATPAMLDVCDSLGMLVIDENRLMGTNDEHLSLLRRMIERDRNHPSVILWSIGNEEWAIESGEKGEAIARVMSDFVHELDSTRPTTYGNAGGFGIVKNVDIHGYNYIVQNDVDNRHRQYPDWFVVGTEETSGCGTRNVYWTDSVRGWMCSINYEGEERSGGEKNVIERGWKFYRDNTWAGGLFYWTGFDYRGEPNPMVWPATGSQFGILDYCGFPKDEAYYLKAAWTDEPVLHIFPHWNLKGHEGEQIDVWAYSNCDEVELLQDGKSLGRKSMPKDGHIVWTTTYQPGKLVAYGFRNGRKILTEKVETTGEAVRIGMTCSEKTLKTDGQDIVVVDLTLYDKKGRMVPDACERLIATVDGPADILGYGNGDPGFKGVERPATADKQSMQIESFMGHAQIILRGKRTEKAPITLSVQMENGTKAIVRL